MSVYFYLVVLLPAVRFSSQWVDATYLKLLIGAKQLIKACSPFKKKEFVLLVVQNLG